MSISSHWLFHYIIDAIMPLLHWCHFHATPLSFIAIFHYAIRHADYFLAITLRHFDAFHYLRLLYYFISDAAMPCDYVITLSIIIFHHYAWPLLLAVYAITSLILIFHIIIYYFITLRHYWCLPLFLSLLITH